MWKGVSGQKQQKNKEDSPSGCTCVQPDVESALFVYREITYESVVQKGN